MDKIRLNNQIISMRKHIKQAKIHVVHKLVKNYKGLQGKKGTEVQIAKNQRKAEKLLLEIKIIKKLNVDSVSKTALLKEKDWQSILDNKSSTSEERSLALITSFAPVQDAVNKFHEDEPKLATDLPDFIEQWEKDKNNPEKKRLRKKKKTKTMKQNINGNSRQSKESDFSEKRNVGDAIDIPTNCEEAKDECSVVSKSKQENLAKNNADLVRKMPLMKEKDRQCVLHFVISMRKYVKQAKMHIIHNLITIYKSLQEKNGTEVERAKSKRKSDKLLSKIKIIKKLNVDSVSKMALLKEKDWQSILDNKSSTTEELSLALIANFESVQEAVNKFYEDEPQLVAVLPDVIEQRAKDTNNLEKKRLRKANKNKTIEQTIKANSQPPKESDFLAKLKYNDSGFISISRNLKDESSVRNKSTQENSAKKVIDLNLNEYQNEILFEPVLVEENVDSSISEEKPFRIKDDPFFGEPKIFEPKNAEHLETLEFLKHNNPCGGGFRKNDNYHSSKPSFSSRGGRSFSSLKSFTRSPKQDLKNHGRSFDQRQDRQPKTYSNHFQSKSKSFFNHKAETATSNENTNSPKDAPFHPSWEAKKKLMKQCVIIPTQAKRIKFDS